MRLPRAIPIAFFSAQVAIVVAFAHPVLAQSQQMGPGGAKPGTLQSGPSAVQAQPNGGATRPTKATTKGISKLTEQECTTAGGTVYKTGSLAKACASGATCGTKDENNVQHFVCISKAN
jgi:hypothetical protein